MIKRKICVITGTRSEYGLLKPIMREVLKKKNLKLLLMVTGMHLSKEFGDTVKLIKKDGFEISYKVKMNPENDKSESMSLAIGKGIIGITKEFTRNKPDITLILGDRIEALAGAITSAYLNIPLAHIHGGDVSRAGLDESARHAITKMSNIHFAATEKSMERIIKMGENYKNVFLVGAPGLDTILKKPLLSKEELEKRFNLDFNNPFLLVLQHSITTQIENARHQIKQTLDAIKELKLPTYIIYPNSDAGGRAIIKEIKKIRHLKFVKIFKNIQPDLYLSFLKHASVLIGNSSSGIIESPALKVPVVNIGIRQNGRERSINVLDVDHDKDVIIKAVEKALYDKDFKKQVKRCRNPYGNGHAGEKIADILSKVKLNNRLLQKQIAY